MTKIDRRTTALIAIDMQRDFLDPGGYAATAGLDVTLLRGAIPGVKRLLAAARSAGIVVVHTRECNSPDLSDVPPAVADATSRSGAPVGSPGPLGRLLVRGEPGVQIIDELSPIHGEIVIDNENLPPTAFQRIGGDAVVPHEQEQLIAGNPSEPAARHTESLQLSGVEAANDRLLTHFANLGGLASCVHSLLHLLYHPLPSRGTASQKRSLEALLIQRVSPKPLGFLVAITPAILRISQCYPQALNWAGRRASWIQS